MPINNSELSAMERKYGKKKGRSVYFASENKGSQAFRKGLKTAASEGHTSANLAAYKRKRRKGRKA